jgi:hypothetical protein
MPPGLDAEEMAAACERERVAPSREALLWWGWRDGSSLQILPGLDHIALAAALEGRRILRDLAADIAGEPPQTDPDAWWNPGWIPIFSTGGLSKIALDCSAEREALSPVRQIDWDGFGGSHYARAFARSLGEYVARAVRCLSGGRYTYDGERDMWLPMDWPTRRQASASDVNRDLRRSEPGEDASAASARSRGAGGERSEPPLRTVENVVTNRVSCLGRCLTGESRLMLDAAGRDRLSWLLGSATGGRDWHWWRCRSSSSGIER